MSTPKAGTVEWAADQLGTTVRSVRRMIRDRRIGYLQSSPGARIEILPRHITEYRRSIEVKPIRCRPAADVSMPSPSVEVVDWPAPP